MSDIFGAEDLAPDDNDISVSLDDLVGEGRKYKDVNELAKAYAHADALIAQRKAEDVAKEAELKVLRDLVNARKPTTATEETPPVRHNPPVQEPPKVETPDLQKLVRDELNNANAETRRVTNINEAAEVLNKVFGSPAKAQEAIRQKAAELGVGFDWLKDTAAASPAAFYRTMDIDPAARSASTPGFRNDLNVRPGSSDKNFAYYENIRKTNLKLYNSPEMRSQMFKSAQELGDKFYSKT